MVHKTRFLIHLIVLFSAVLYIPMALTESWAVAIKTYRASSR